MKENPSSPIRFITSKLFIVIVLVIVIIAGVTIATISLTNKGGGMKLRQLPTDIEMRTVSDYKESRLHLYKNGTFAFEVIYKDFPEFTGLGYYTKSGKRYTFTYIDMWRLTGNSGNYEKDYKRDETVLKNGNGDNFVSSKNGDIYTVSVHYTKDKKGRIEIKDPLHKAYYFK